MNTISISKPSKNLVTIFLVAIWVLGNAWTYIWFIDSFSHTSILNIIILTIVVTAVSIQLWRNHIFKLESFSPQYKLYPLLLMLGGELSAIAIKWTIYLPQLTFACFILASYGLLGLFINLSRWQKNLSLVIIGACIIPFAIAFNSGLGFPVRVITAHFVADILSYFHLGAVSSHDIILMENGIAQVDLPCSGMKSLWLGTVFLLGVTWLEKRQLGLRWVGVAITNIFFLAIANFTRVLILVLLIEVAKQKQIAEVLHLPLGIIGFVFASICTWILLQKVPSKSNLKLKDDSKSLLTKKSTFKKELQPTIDVTPISNQKKPSFNWLLIVVFTLAIIGQFKPPVSSLIAIKSIDFPLQITTENLALSQAEINFFDNPANPLVQKMRFQTDNLSGSMLIVASNTWHAHHPPELCFVGNGFKVDRMNSTLLNNTIHARWLSLQDGDLSATYWFQSSDETTDNFVSRLWEDITHQNKTWVLVSVLFDNSLNSNDTEVNTFTNTIYTTIEQNLS